MSVWVSCAARFLAGFNKLSEACCHRKVARFSCMSWQERKQAYSIFQNVKPFMICSHKIKNVSNYQAYTFLTSTCECTTHGQMVAWL